MKRTNKKTSATKKAKTPQKKKTGAKTKAKVISLSSKLRSKARSTASTGGKKKSQHATPPSSPGSVIRKFLEMKEARRKQAAEARGHQRWNDNTNHLNNQQNQNVAKFAGPRRRAV